MGYLRELVPLETLYIFGLLSVMVVPSKAYMTQIYSHRTFSGLYPESSLIGIEESLKLGVDFIDMDIVLNRDQTLMVTHDACLHEDLVRDKNKTFLQQNDLLVKKLSTEQLKQFDIGQVRPGSPTSKEFPERKSYENVKIPTLEEAITTILQSPLGTHTNLQIEIKANPYKPSDTFPVSQIIKQLIKVLKKYPIQDKVEIQSFNWKALALLQKELPSVKTAYLHQNPPLMEGSSSIILDPIWTDGYLPKDYDNSIPKMIKSLGGAVWGPSHLLVTKKLVEEAHQYGLKVVPWTVDDKETMKYLIDCGVDGIITNRPDLLKDILKNH